MKEIKKTTLRSQSQALAGGLVTQGSFVKSENREACYYEYGNFVWIFFRNNFAQQVREFNWAIECPRHAIKSQVVSAMLDDGF